MPTYPEKPRPRRSRLGVWLLVFVGLVGVLMALTCGVALVPMLRTPGLEKGTILALSRRQDFPTAALRAAFPEARIAAADYRVYAPPPNPAPGDCLLLWSGATEWPGLWSGAPATPVPRLGLPLPAAARLGAIEAKVHLSGRDAHGLRYALVEGGLGDCR